MTVPTKVDMAQGIAAIAGSGDVILGTECTGSDAPIAMPRGGARLNAGAPKRNRNALKTGLYGVGWPKGTDHYRRRHGRFVRGLEFGVLRLHGEIDIVAAAEIQAAGAWERHALLCAFWLRKEAATLTPDQRLAFSRDIARAAAERNRCIRALGLGAKRDVDPWAALDAQQTNRDVTHASASPGDQWTPSADGMHELSTTSPVARPDPHDRQALDGKTRASATNHDGDKSPTTHDK